jgi:putative heme-binding domain-containing protein
MCRQLIVAVRQHLAAVFLDHEVERLIRSGSLQPLPSAGGRRRSHRPDLAGAAARYSRRDLGDAMIHPSRVIDEKYRDSRVLTADGEVVVGQLAVGNQEELYFSNNPLEPTQITRIRRDSIDSRQASQVSSMPTGLLNTLMEEEILDLMAWVESGGKK